MKAQKPKHRWCKHVDLQVSLGSTDSGQKMVFLHLQPLLEVHGEGKSLVNLSGRLRGDAGVERN